MTFKYQDEKPQITRDCVNENNEKNEKWYDGDKNEKNEKWYDGDKNEKNEKRYDEDKNEKNEKCYDDEPEAPEDILHLTTITVVLIGLLNFLSLTFFTSANDYWMYKFRNVTLNTTDADHRTDLQAFFSSSTMFVFSITTFVSGSICAFWGYKFDARKRLIFGLSVQTCGFIVSTVLVKVDTNSWQGAFFGLTMFILICIYAATIVNIFSSYTILTKLPLKYTSYNLYGQGFADIGSASLQILCLYIGGDSETTALIYFVIGTTLHIITLLMIISARKFKHLSHYMTDNLTGTKSKTYRWDDFREFFTYGSQTVVVFCVSIVEVSLTNASVTPLIVSENYGYHLPWNDKYFVPTVTFLLASICSLIGRFVASFFRLDTLNWFFVLLCVLRSFVFASMTMLCNAKPRHHLPILFPHDWEYALIIMSKSVINGIFNNMGVLHLRKNCPPEKLEKAFNIQQTIFGILGVCIAPLSLVSVKLL